MDEGQVFDKYVSRIKSRLHYQNKNWLAIICGETGSGKSYSALSFALDISPNVHIVFNPMEFLQLINSKRIKKGDVVIFDEAGVGMSSREWYSIQNKLLGTVLQTFRNMNIAVIFTTPNLSFIDVQARKLFHTYMETVNIDYEKGLAFLKVFDIQVNGRFDKTYYKRPKFSTEEGNVFKMSHLGLNKPSEEWVERYEALKEEYTKKLNENALKSLEEARFGKEKKPEVDLNKVMDTVRKNPTKYVKEYNKRSFVDRDLLRSEFGISITEANNVKKRIEPEVL